MKSDYSCLSLERVKDMKMITMILPPLKHTRSGQHALGTWHGMSDTSYHLKQSSHDPVCMYSSSHCLTVANPTDIKSDLKKKKKLCKSNDSFADLLQETSHPTLWVSDKARYLSTMDSSEAPFSDTMLLLWNVNELSSSAPFHYRNNFYNLYLPNPKLYILQLLL